MKFWITFFLITLSFNLQASLPTHDSQGKELPSLAPMLDKITDSVVNISTTATVKARNGFSQQFFNDPLFNRFFGLPQQRRNPSQEKSSLGSGVIINAKSGYVLTNNHVIENANNIKVTLKNGHQYTAELIGTDEKTDVALLKIPAKNLTAIPMANSDKIRVGDFVVAIGNPFGIGQTVTSGIVSALGRNNLGIEGYEDFIQTDASINPGNSGGALVNLQGELIGINTAILSKSGGNVGIGFAIPINMVNSIKAQLLQHGQVSRGVLGVHIQDLTPDLASALNISYKSGAIIAQVIDKSSAAKAGLKNGDIVIKANNKEINDAADLRNFIGLMRPSEQVTLLVVRGTQEMLIKATVSGDNEVLLSSNEFNAKDLHASPEGAYLSQNTKSQGLEVSEIKQGSPAWETGLKVGDRIISINRIATNSINDVKKLIKRKFQRMAINILRGDTGLFLVLD